VGSFDKFEVFFQAGEGGQELIAGGDQLHGGTMVVAVGRFAVEGHFGDGEARDLADRAGDLGEDIAEGADLDLHFAVDEAGFDGIAADQAPVDSGDILNDTEFDGVGGLEAGDVAGDMFVEGVAVLVGEDGGMVAIALPGFGIAAVFEGILAGALLAFRSNRPAGFRAVSARGFRFPLFLELFLLIDWLFGHTLTYARIVEYETDNLIRPSEILAVRY
jgi:hypothetical protein